MAKNRSRRLRKKMHIDEFQELGFSVAWRFPEGTSEEQIDKTVDDFINEVIEPNKLAFDGSGYLAWEGLICMQEIGKCTEEHQAIVRKWLEERKLDEHQMLSVVLPHFVIKNLWHRCLHNQTAMRLERAFYKMRNVSVISMPYVL